MSIMKTNTLNTIPKGAGISSDIPNKVPESGQIASGSARSEQETSTYSGMRGNIVLYLADRQDRVAERQNKKIERIEQRLTIIEERDHLS
jgi:hypothetical protein